MSRTKLRIQLALLATVAGPTVASAVDVGLVNQSEKPLWIRWKNTPVLDRGVCVSIAPDQVSSWVKLEPKQSVGKAQGMPAVPKYEALCFEIQEEAPAPVDPEDTKPVDLPECMCVLVEQRDENENLLPQIQEITTKKESK
jgi:hypothetical protein